MKTPSDSGRRLSYIAPMTSVPTGPAPPAPARRSLPQHHEPPPAPPPFPLIGGHFGAAACWLTVGALGLVAVAPELARGNFLAPRVLAVVHCFTIGVITTTIFGVLHQFLPMALAHHPRSARAGYAGLGFLSAGTAALVAGFWWWIPALQGTGWLLAFTAVAVYEWNLASRGRRPPEHRLVRRYLLAAHAAFGLVLLLAAARIGDSLGWWRTDRLGLIAAHFHLAAFGFASFVAVGLGSRMIPSFLVSHGTPGWPLRVIGLLGGAGLLAFAVGETWHLIPLAGAGAVLLLGAGAVYLRLAWGYFSRRLRRRLDPAAAHIAAAWSFLLVTLAAGGSLLLERNLHPRLWAFYGAAAILGWLLPLIFGVEYKILAHLTWIHRHRRGTTGAESAAELLDPRLAWTSLVLLVGGLAALGVGIVAGVVPLATVAAAVWAGGALLVPAQYARMLMR